MKKTTVPRANFTLIDEKNVLNVASVSSFDSYYHQHDERQPLLSRYSALKKNFGFKSSSNNKKEDNCKKQKFGIVPRYAQRHDDKTMLAEHTKIPAYKSPYSLTSSIVNVIFEEDECLTIPPSPDTTNETSKKTKQKGLIPRYAQQQPGKTRKVALLPSGARGVI